MMKQAILVGCCLAVYMADSAGGQAGPARDSAGIHVVDNTRPRWTDSHRWRVAEKPLLEIGDGRGAMYELDGVTAVLGLSGGRVAIGSLKTNQFRLFDSSGSFLSSMGRSGHGLGEFTGLLRASVLHGDSLVGYSSGDRRVNVFTPSGRVARSFSLVNRSGQLTVPEGWFGDGGLVASARVHVPQANLGRITDSAVIQILDSGGKFTRTVGTIPVGERVETGRSSSNVVFGRQATLAVREGSFYVGGWDRIEVRQFDRRGRLRRIMRRPYAPIAVSEADMQRVSAANSSGGTGQRARSRPTAYTFASYYAPVGTVLVDATGAVWVESLNGDSFRVRRGGPGIPTTPTAVRWTVFDSLGTWLGEVELPARFTPTAIGENWVLGLWRDNDLVEYVRKYRLLKPR